MCVYSKAELASTFPKSRALCLESRMSWGSLTPRSHLGQLLSFTLIVRTCIVLYEGQRSNDQHDDRRNYSVCMLHNIEDFTVFPHSILNFRI